MDTKAIQEMLGSVLPAVNGRAFPWMEGVLLEADEDGYLRMTATNEVFTLASGSYEVNVAEAGTVLVNAKSLNGIVSKAQNGTVEIVGAGKGLAIKTKSGKYKIATMEAEGFRGSTKIEGIKEEEQRMLAQDLFGLIRRARSVVLNDETRPVLCGVNLQLSNGTLLARGTDGARIGNATAETELRGSFNIIVPFPALSSIMGICAKGNMVGVLTDGKKLRVTNDKGDELCTTLVYGSFPDVGKVFREHSNTLIAVDSKELKDAVARAIVTSDKKAVEISTVNGIATLKASGSIGTASEEMECEQSGQDFGDGILLDATLLSSILTVTDGKITIGIENAVKPVMIMPYESSERYRFGIAPLRKMYNDEASV